jgi:hydrophobic/amphiphilic exporter-1 (mainly G- bacteria), HAE1 family
MSIDDVRTVLGTATVNAPKGTIDGPLQDFTVYTNDQLTAAEAYNDVILAYRNGAPVRVRDVGRAIDGPQDARQAAWARTSSGVERAVVLIVFKSPGANVIDTVDRVKAALPQVRAAVPPAMKIDVVSDRTQTIRASVDDVQITLMITAALVVMVIFLFLRSSGRR